MSLNQNEVLTPWSLRDISKLFARIYKQSKNPKNYEGLGLHENILNLLPRYFIFYLPQMILW